jgi:hypothetical protein
VSPRAGRLRLVALLLAGTTSLAGCSWLEDDPVAAPGREQQREPARPALLDDADRLDAAVADLLDRRATLLRRGDVDGVVAQTVDDAAARRAQRRYAVNLSRLPVGVLRYESPPEVAVDGDDVRVRVRQVLQLSRFDAGPVRSEHELVLRPARRDRLRVVSEAPVSDDPSTGGAQPWDLRPIGTLRQDGVLGVFDVGSADYAPEVVSSAAGAADDVRDAVPYRWTRPVVVYAPSDLVLLDAISGLPGGVADRLEGVSFPVRSTEDGPVHAERVILNPGMLDADPAERDRLLRHELTHVALGARDELVPRWLAEGLAEWVSVQPLPAEERLISAAAVREARAGIDDLPSDEEFNDGPRSSANYDIAWQVCEGIAFTYGRRAPWMLLDAMIRRPRTDPDVLVRRVLGTTGPRLASAAADRILAQYG